eukprot:TRINITY_DN2320_c0_g1_i2.p1 TRINITY_DN2320_c0_g1~~TRINITY_DN2320_c0_g1_i2.p1  ORF type:complete len:114 (-),score=63.71 TRINITY_DN2320_c0_g1_i2:86-427(-)
MSVIMICFFFFFLMIRRPPRSTQSRSSAASDVYKRQFQHRAGVRPYTSYCYFAEPYVFSKQSPPPGLCHPPVVAYKRVTLIPVSYTHLRAHETVLDLVCRLLLEKKKKKNIKS